MCVCALTDRRWCCPYSLGEVPRSCGEAVQRVSHKVGMCFILSFALLMARKATSFWSIWSSLLIFLIPLNLFVFFREGLAENIEGYHKQVNICLQNEVACCLWIYLNYLKLKIDKEPFVSLTFRFHRAHGIKQWSMWFSVLKICAVLWIKLRHPPSLMPSRGSNALSTCLEHVLQRSDGHYFWSLCPFYLDLLIWSINTFLIDRLVPQALQFQLTVRSNQRTQTVSHTLFFVTLWYKYF